MKILMVHNDYRLVGGERQSVREDVRGLAGLGHDVQFLEVSNSEANVPTLGGGILGFRTSAHGQVRDAIMQARPDVVHVQNMFPVLGGALVDVLREQHVPWVRTLRNYRIRCIAGTCFRAGRPCTDCRGAAHGLPGIRHRCYRGSSLQSAGAVVYAQAERRAVERYPPDAYIVLSESMLPLLHDQLMPQPTYVRGNAVAAVEADPLTASQRRYTFAFVGRLEREKGFATVVQAAEELTEYDFVVAGDGPERDTAARAASALPNVTYLGAIERTQVAGTLRDSKYLLMPSLWSEPFGRVALEAMAQGTVPLTSELGGPASLARQIATDLIGPPPLEGWAEFLGEWAQLPDADFARLSERAREQARVAGSPRALAISLVQIYTEAISAHGSRK